MRSFSHRGGVIRARSAPWRYSVEMASERGPRMSSGEMHCLVWGLPVAVRYRVSAPLSEFTHKQFDLNEYHHVCMSSRKSDAASIYRSNQQHTVIHIQSELNPQPANR